MASFLNRTYLGGGGLNGAVDKAIQQHRSKRALLMQKLSTLPPAKLKALQAQVNRQVANMTPVQRRMYQRIVSATENDYMHPRSLGNAATIIGGIANGLAAVGSVYIAYEGMKQSEKDQERQAKLQEQQLAMERQQQEARMAALRQQMAQEEQLFQAQMTQSQQQNVAQQTAGEGKILGMDKNVALVAGAGAAAVVGMAVLNK